jgi:hypothetical protein
LQILEDSGKILVIPVLRPAASYSGADPGIGGGALKKIAPSGGRCEKFWDISCEKSRFYAKKFFVPNFSGGAPTGLAPDIIQIVFIKE